MLTFLTHVWLILRKTKKKLVCRDSCQSVFVIIIIIIIINIIIIITIIIVIIIIIIIITIMTLFTPTFSGFIVILVKGKYQKNGSVLYAFGD